MAGLTNFAVFSQPTPDITSVIMLEPNTSEYTYIVSAINIGLSMLETPQGRDSLTELALLFDANRSSRDKSHRFGENPGNARRAVDLFLSKVRAMFPMVVIDHSMTNLDLLGEHQRGEWTGALEDFNPRGQAIWINTRRVNDMVASAGPGGQPFRDFQFLFATTFFHEVGGHLLITYLNNGRANTPRQVGGELGYSANNVGESGRLLELRLLGGTTEWFKGQLGRPAGYRVRIEDVQAVANDPRIRLRAY